MIVKAIFTALIAIGAMNFAHANEACKSPPKDLIDVSLDAAIEKDPSTAGMREATNAAREKWDKEMNASYARLMKVLSPTQRQALQASQRNWLAFRNSEFKVISEIVASQDGTMYELMATDNGMELIKARALDLRAYEAAISNP